MESKLERWLRQRYSPGSVRLYARDIAIYINDMGEEQAVNASRSDLMGYVERLRGRYANPLTVTRVLYAIKAYYSWLIESGAIDGHPCRSIKLRDAKPKPLQLQDLLKPEELEALMERQERFSTAAIKNQVMVSLLIYQAVIGEEMAGLKTSDVDLEAGYITVRPTRRLNGRKLPLKPAQIMLFYKYLNEVRPKLIKSVTDAFIVTLRGSAGTGEEAQYLLETMREKFPGRAVNPKTIRMSVIHNMLKAGYDLRVVQAFAGHKKISSTERYRPSADEELKAAVTKYHPLR
jgi:integrase/recombinase XerD